MFTATTVLCNSIKDCLELEISQNSYPGILNNYLRKIWEISANFGCLKYSEL